MVVKRFKVEGWFRMYDEKDFMELTLIEHTANDAIIYFCKYHIDFNFYKITVEEIK